ncbi:hypothetical protein [Ponticoccus alexandrii]|uniref:Tail protein n=1 Tax=Ponticoccus alexandrii TaxID=1943633 RepID=A0ABX7F8E9_9RHOB|nr:hypothetical protein [Ponticoccus alexandrii]QRF66389.1 hypothetical protein GQA70_08740 [Ponticoccus alexandrii]
MSFPNGGAVQIWRDGDTYEPKKSEMRAWGADVEGRVEDLEATATSGARYIRDTLLDLNAIAAPANGDIGFVLADDSNAGTWQYQGAAWVRVADLPRALSGFDLAAAASAAYAAASANAAASSAEVVAAYGDYLLTYRPQLAATYGIRTANAAAENDAAFLTVPAGQSIDLREALVEATALPENCIAYNGAIKVGSDIIPMTRDRYDSAFEGTPVVVNGFEAGTFWLAGLFRRHDRDEWWCFTIPTPSHGMDKRRGTLEANISQGGMLKFEKTVTVYSDGEGYLWNGAHVTQIEDGYLGIVRKDDTSGGAAVLATVALLSAGFSAPVEIDLSSEIPGLVHQFPMGQAVRWPAEFGGHDVKGWLFPGYAGNSSKIHLIGTTDEGATGSWSQIEVGDKVGDPIPQGGGNPDKYPFYPSETVFVTVPGKGVFAFARPDGRSVAQTLHFKACTALDLLTWPDWIDTGIPCGANVPHVIYHHGIVELLIVQRELWSELDESAGPADNIGCVYRFTPDQLLALDGVFPQQFTVDLVGMNRFVGYLFTAFDKRGVPYSVGKMGETVFSNSADNERADMAVFTPLKLPVAAPHYHRPRPKQIIENGNFQHWPYGANFNLAGSADVITAARMKFAPSGAATDITRETLDYLDRAVAGHGQKYAYGIDNVADPDNNTGLYQSWYGRDAEEKGNLIATSPGGYLMLEGFGEVPAALQAQVGLFDLSGSDSDILKNTPLLRPNTTNGGFWRTVSPIQFPRLTSALDFDANSYARIRIDNGSGVSSWMDRLTRFEVYLGDQPGDRTWVDQAEDAERCKRYGWYIGGEPGFAGTELARLQYRAGSVNAWQGRIALNHALAIPITNVEFSASSDFQVVTGGGASTVTAITSIVATELEGDLGGFTVLATTGGAAPADGAIAFLRAASDSSKITYKTGH